MYFIHKSRHVRKKVPKLSSISWDKIEFKEVRKGNNFPFNRKDSTYREAVIPKISCSALKMAALWIFSKDVSFEISFTIESERTSYIISTSPSTRGDVCPSAIRWKWAWAKISPGTPCESCLTPPGPKLQGAYNSTKNFEIFETRTNGTENSWEKFQKIRKLLNFRKANHSTENSRKFRDESQMERKFPGKNFRKFGYTSRGCPLFRNLCKFPIFYSALASSFGRDHSELDISRKDDGDAHSIKTHFRTFPINTTYS